MISIPLLILGFLIIGIGVLLWRTRFRAAAKAAAIADSALSGDGLQLTRQTGLWLDSSVPHDRTHAHYLASACDIAYKPESVGKDRFRSELNLSTRLISIDNTQVYVGENEESIVVAFRGSEFPGSIDGFKDWLLTNSRNFLVLPEGRIGTDFAAAGVGARFHRGFMAALEEVWAPLLTSVEAARRRSDRPLWITGHSLGGAIALLAAWRFHQAFLPVHQIVTFGAPMVGNQAAADAYHREFPGKIFRYVDFSDLVPKMPTMSLLSNQYNHVQKEIVLGGDGQVAQNMLAAIAAGAPDASVNIGTPPTTPLEEKIQASVWQEVHGQIEAHLLTNYLARLSKT